MASPTQRTLTFFRGLGYDAAVVEKYVTMPGQPHGIRQDAFGFIDILAFKDKGITAIQATSASNVSSRIKKILESPVARRWVCDPTRHILVIGWKKYAKPVDRKWWRHTMRYLTLGDFDGPTRRKHARRTAAVS